jgi:hypothetical protein
VVLEVVGVAQMALVQLGLAVLAHLDKGMPEAMAAIGELPVGVLFTTFPVAAAVQVLLVILEQVLALVLVVQAQTGNP